MTAEDVVVVVVVVLLLLLLLLIFQRPRSERKRSVCRVICSSTRQYL